MNGLIKESEAAFADYVDGLVDVMQGYRIWAMIDLANSSDHQERFRLRRIEGERNEWATAFLID